MHDDTARIMIFEVDHRLPEAIQEGTGRLTVIGRPHSFDIVLKVAERCNLACNYCYYYFQDFDANVNAPVMRRDVIDATAGYLVRSLRDVNVCGFNFVLHGGEPLLMKPHDMDYLCSRLRAELEHRTDIRFLVQTNGTLINENWISLFEKHNIAVGFSIDGPRELHDAHRRDHVGRGSYDSTIRGLRLVQQAVKLGRLRALGTISVLPICEDSAEILRHLVQDLEIQDPNLNFPHAGWDSPDAVRWGREVESHRRAVRYALEGLLYPKFHHVRGVTNFLLTLKSEKGATYNDERVAHRHHIATISSEGVVQVDDNMLGVDARLSRSGLSVFDGSLRDLVESEPFRAMNDALDETPSECAACRWCRSCRSGDLFNRFSKADGFKRKSVLCDTLLMIHEEAENFLVEHRLAARAEIDDLLAVPPRYSAADSYRILLSDPEG
jgi:uncharacterized protein